jgi:hypothetical protein
VRRSTAAFSLALLAALLASACEPGDPLEGGVASATLSFPGGHDDGVAAELHAEGDVEREVCEDSGDDRGDGDDGPDRCHDDGGGRGSRFLVGQLYPLFLDR